MVGGVLAGAPDSEQCLVVCYSNRNDGEVVSGESRDRRKYSAGGSGGVGVVESSSRCGVLDGESRETTRRCVASWSCFGPTNNGP
jgi:hypothetical protein